VVQGSASVLVALALLLCDLVSPLLLGAVVLALQVVLVLGLLALVDAPAAGGVFVVGVSAAVAADLAVLHDHGRLGALAGIVALSLVAALLHQLGRRARTRVTESLADTLFVVVLVCGCACLLAVRELGGARLAAIVLAAVGVSLLVGRLGDAFVARPAVTPAATRGWPGLVLALGLGVAVAALLGGDHLSARAAALLGLAVAAAAAAGDVAVDLTAVAPHAAVATGDVAAAPGAVAPHAAVATGDVAAAPGATAPRADDGRRAAARRPVGLLLPFAAAGPVAYVAARLVLAGT
jgi:hypothetical protein